MLYNILNYSILILLWSLPFFLRHKIVLAFEKTKNKLSYILYIILTKLSHLLARTSCNKPTAYSANDFVLSQLIFSMKLGQYSLVVGSVFAVIHLPYRATTL